MKNLGLSNNSVIKILNRNNIKCYIFGGFVRDYYLKIKSISPMDIVCISDQDSLISLFSDKVYSVDRVNGIIKIKYNTKFYNLHILKKLELDNTFVSYKLVDNVAQDSETRDLTINSIYYEPFLDKIEDPNNGIQDIKNKIFKFIRDPEARVLESKIRMIRLIRFISKFGKKWTIDLNTINETKKHSLKLVVLEPPVLYQELIKVFTELKTPSTFFRLLDEFDLLENVFPELSQCKGIPQNKNRYVPMDLFEHIMLAIDAVDMHKDNYVTLRIAALLHDIGKPYTTTNLQGNLHFFNHENVGAMLGKKILSRWGFNDKFIQKINTLIKHHLFDDNTISDKKIKKLIMRVGPENINDLLDLRIADRLGTGRKNISMKKIEILRSKINIVLSVISPENFRLDFLDSELSEISHESPEEIPRFTKAAKQYLITNILTQGIKNNFHSLKKEIKSLQNIKCPLGQTHLFETWNSILTESADTFPDGKLKCGVYCGFTCDNRKPRHGP